LPYGLGKNPGAAHVIVVAVYAGHHCMPQAERSDRLSHAPRLVPVNRLGTPFRHRTEAATPGADIAQQHEGRGVMVPAFSNIRTLRRLAHRMQSQPARQLLQIMKVVAHRSLGLEPRRLRAVDAWAKVNLDELGRGRHDVHRFYQLTILPVGRVATSVTFDPLTGSASASPLATPPPRWKSAPSRERCSRQPSDAPAESPRTCRRCVRWPRGNAGYARRCAGRRGAPARSRRHASA